MNLFSSVTSFSSHSSLKYFYFCFCHYCFVLVSIVPAISLLLLHLLLDIWAWNKDTVLLSSIQWSEEVKSLSCVRLFVTPWTVACQAPLSMGFSRQEYWSGLPFPSPGDLPSPGIEPGSPALEGDALTSEPPGKPLYTLCCTLYSTVHKVQKSTTTGRRCTHTTTYTRHMN